MNIEKQQIIDYFDRCAPFWDGDMIKDEEIVNLILEGADVRAGKTVLDVATGTGVLIPNYLERGVASVTAVDLSPEMIQIAKYKFHEDNVKFICCDVFDAVNEVDKALHNEPENMLSGEGLAWYTDAVKYH